MNTIYENNLKALKQKNEKLWEAFYTYAKQQKESRAFTAVAKNGEVIIRYPEGKEDVTGIGFEPWHIRYVGIPHAKIMYRNNWTLEEYYENLEVGDFYALHLLPDQQSYSYQS